RPGGAPPEPRRARVARPHAPRRRGLPDVPRRHRGRLPHLRGRSGPARGDRPGALRGGRHPHLPPRPPAPAPAGAGARGRPHLPVDLRRAPRCRGDGARGVQHVRDPLRGPPRPHPHPHARGLGGPPAAQGPRDRPHPRPVQGPPGRPLAMSTVENLPFDPTDEGSQEMAPRGSAGAAELLRELGATLRMSEAEVAELVQEDPSEDQTMIINMGPQHPSTHGVLRLMLELEGETVLRTKPVIGYLHTGMEKTGEDLTYLQGPTNVTRMDYASPLFNELAFSLTTEKLLGIDEDIPERAQWIRVLMTELNRIT